MEYFFSKSKKGDVINCGNENWRQVLSNFYSSEIMFGNDTYSCVESLFQFFKFENHKEYANKFKTYDSKSAKQMGGKTMCRKNKIQIDVDWWNSVRVVKMKKCIDLRYECDEEFRKIINCCKNKNITIVHFSRNDMYWGAKIKDGKIEGKNMLGKIIMEKYT